MKHSHHIYPYLNTHMILQRHIIQRMGEWWKLTCLFYNPRAALNCLGSLFIRKTTALQIRFIASFSFLFFSPFILLLLWYCSLDGPNVHLRALVDLFFQVWITDMDIYMGWEIKVPALVSLTFHWHIMENQTPLSVHRAIKDKCVCYCSHSVFLSVLCPPLGDVKARCRTAINPKLLVVFFFIAKGACCLAEDWPWLRAG